VPILVYVIGSTLGSDREAVLGVFSNPVIAILTGLGLFVGMAHFRKGAQMMIEDYWKKSTKKVLIISVIVLSYGLTAFGLFALAKIAL
jgi:succinate dehydrogenase / fumarate reductase membrane anchor subunit